MKLLLSLLKIIRINNALIAGCAVLLGYWLSRSDLPSASLILLFCTALVSTGFGNVINDLRDMIRIKSAIQTGPYHAAILVYQVHGSTVFFWHLPVLSSLFQYLLHME
jgi:4-hydroxybenzoate polyprenyltransferase